jgi:Uma2 family endonuclease
MVIVEDELKEIIFPKSDLLSDEPPMETELHLRQLMLLIQSLELLWKDRQDFYAFGNLTIYYSSNHRKSEYFRGADFLVVLGVARKPRKSWVVWEEDGKYPHVIIEILSDSTAETDRGLKKEIYQETFRTPNYFWFDPNSLEFKGFQLMVGKYEEIAANEQGWLWSQQLELFLGIHDSQLRFFTPEGKLVPTPEEVAEKMAQKLQDLGIDWRDLA